MTGLIPQAFIDTLLSRIDIADVISSRVALRRQGANFLARCPFHTEKTPSFTVSSSKQFYHCFGCGASGDVIRFLMEYEGLTFVEACESLASLAGLECPTEANSDPTQLSHSAIFNMLTETSKFYQKTLKEHPEAFQAKNYLKSRGLTGQIAKHFNLGFSLSAWDSLIKTLGTDQKKIEILHQGGLLIKKEKGGYYDRFRSRITFPIRDRRGRVIGFGGRLIIPGEPKYLNSPETPIFKKGHNLYGLYEARLGNRHLTELIVVEGYMDVIALVQFDIKNVVATLGTALTSDQVEILFKQVNELIFCFDGDKAGRNAAQRALPLILPKMKEGRRVKFLLLPNKEDPDSYIRKNAKAGFLKQIEHAKPLSDFLFETVSHDLDLNHLDGRAELVTRSKPLIALLPSGILKQMLYERLAELAHIAAERIAPRSQQKTFEKKPKFSASKTHPFGLPFRALALLLENRNLITETEIENWEHFDTLNMIGMPLFLTVVKLLQVEPNISIETLIAKLPVIMQTEINPPLLKKFSTTVPEAGIQQEFLAIMRRLREEMENQVMDSLIIKAKIDELTDSEKTKLKELIEGKEKNRVD